MGNNQRLAQHRLFFWLFLLQSPHLGCKQTVHLKASARHANCRSTSWRSDWQKHQHATWLNVLEENQNTDSSTSNSTTLCTAVLTEVTGPTYCICKLNTLTFQTEDRCLKAFFFFVASQATPQQMMGRGFSFKPNLLRVGLNFSRATVKNKHWDFSSTVFSNWLKHWHQNHPCVHKDMEDQPNFFWSGLVLHTSVPPGNCNRNN